MKQFSATIQIQASPERVWALLVDTGSWQKWNTTIDHVEGANTVGSKVTVHAKINPGKSFPVNVTSMTAGRKIVWASGMPLGLFKGERTYTLMPNSGGVSFSMTEIYSGPMAGMITKSIPDLQPAFDEFARCLKSEAEKG